MYRKPDFSKLSFSQEPKSLTREEWQKKIEAETGKSLSELCYRTMEQIDVQPLYTKENYDGLTHLDFMAGIPPFLLFFTAGYQNTRALIPHR